jgi:hypothetical protein
MSPSDGRALGISPDPTPEEVAAITAAVEASWPRQVVVLPEPVKVRDTSWRFSSRWWARPVPQRRPRP